MRTPRRSGSSSLESIALKQSHPATTVASPSALTKAGGAIGHMYDRAVIHMTDRDVRA